MTETQDLLRLRNKLQTAKSRQDETQGILKSLFEQLKESFGVKTLPKAREKLKDLKARGEKMRKSLEKGMATLENDYEW